MVCPSVGWMDAAGTVSGELPCGVALLTLPTQPGCGWWPLVPKGGPTLSHVGFEPKADRHVRHTGDSRHDAGVACNDMPLGGRKQSWSTVEHHPRGAACQQGTISGSKASSRDSTDPCGPTPRGERPMTQTTSSRTCSRSHGGSAKASPTMRCRGCTRSRPERCRTRSARMTDETG